MKNLCMDGEAMSDMVDYLTELSGAKYDEYKNVNGVKMIDVHVFMHWLAHWADMGLSEEIDIIMKLLDAMAMANMMLGRLEYPTMVREGSGIRYAALKVDLYKRIERAKESKVKVTKGDKECIKKMADCLMDKIHEVGSY